MLEITAGNYTGVTLAVAINELLKARDSNFVVSYNIPTGTIRIYTEVYDEAQLIIASDFMVMTWSIGGNEPWTDKDGNPVSIDLNNLQSINDALRHDEMTHLDKSVQFYRSYESGFLDLLTVHNIYLHCPNLGGHYSTVGVKGEEGCIIKKYMYLPVMGI